MTISIIKCLTLITMGIWGRRYIKSEFLLFLGCFKIITAGGTKTKAFPYFTWHLLLTVVILTVPFVGNAMCRVPLSLFLLLSILAVVVHRNITGQYAHERAYFDEDTVEILLREADMVGAAFVEYRREILLPIIPGSGILVVLLWHPSAPLSLNAVWGISCFILITITMAEIVLQRYFLHGPGWPFPFPSPVAVPAKLLVHAFRNQAKEPRSSADVQLVHHRSRLDKIVFIMDESVRSDYTSLGDPKVGTTPYLASIESLVNFGNAISGHNCSSYSRYMLRFGAKSGELPEALHGGLNLPGPSIWQYARRAGLETFYIDGFSNLLRLHSGMTLAEAHSIDHYIRIPMAPSYERDIRVAECLRHALCQPGPAFIYVDKYGLHWPYDDKLPKEEAVFEAPAGANREVRMKASYKSALRWSVDGFFKHLMEGLRLEKTAIFYTSDHGQSLLEGGYPLSHCSVGPGIVTGEALVPMAVITDDSELRRELSDAAVIMMNRTSHFDLFPTLLLAFGYDPHDVALSYGSGLYGPAPDTRRFLSGFKTAATWIDVVDPA